MTHLQPAADFNEIVDNLESVTFRRRNSTTELRVDAAYRQQSQTHESLPSAGEVLQTDTVWHLSLATETGPPRPGDLVIDQQGARWTILETEQLVALGRWKCNARDLQLVYGCHSQADVARPVWGDNGSGPEIVDWTDICMALPVNIQLDEMLLDSSTEPPTKQLLYDITLGESIALEPDDRLTAADGLSYRVQALLQANRIDVLPLAKAIREESS